MPQGLICNVADAAHDRMENRDQEPCFVLDDGTPVFEVWFWHEQLKRWFCMSTVTDPRLIAQGVVFFAPADVPDGLREKMRYLERAAGIER